MEEASLKEEYRCGASMRKLYYLVCMLIASLVPRPLPGTRLAHSNNFCEGKNLQRKVGYSLDPRPFWSCNQKGLGSRLCSLLDLTI